MGIPWILGGVHRPDQSSPPCEESMPILWAGESDSRIAPKIENTDPGNKVATTQHVANLIADKLQEQPSYRPVDIVRDIKQQLGVKVSYIKAFRAKDRAIEAHTGTHEDVYAKLPKYC